MPESGSRAWYDLGGPTVFIAGRAWLEHGIFGRVSRARLVGLIVLIVLPVLAPVLAFAPPLAATAAAALVLVGVALIDAAQGRRGPPERPMPQG
ncbi:hypothetical protein [Micromonospora sp. NPDC005806]|uniref:hypothetical protein n=1 Tax=Micromonospora sp. NPDC005806 TaxID=3364234 RepID=UPI003694C794